VLDNGFCHAVDADEEIPMSILDYLVDAFSQYLKGTLSLENALHLNRPKHRRRGTVTVDPIIILSDVPRST